MRITVGLFLSLWISLGLAQDFSLSAGAEYTSGKFGLTERTSQWYWPLTVRYENDALSLRLTVPYLQVSGPGEVIISERIVLAGANREQRTDSGLGDVGVSAVYNLIDDQHALIGVDLGAKIKFGTADEAKRLGTGKNDYSLQAEIFKEFGELTPALLFGYRWLGDTAETDFRNVWYGSASLTWRATQTRTLGIAYDFRQATIIDGLPVSELTAFWTQRLSRETKLSFYLLKGFRDGSPDWGVGFTINQTFF